MGFTLTIRQCPKCEEYFGKGFFKIYEGIDLCCFCILKLVIEEINTSFPDKENKVRVKRFPSFRAMK